MINISITGSTGFVGKNLVVFLKDYHIKPISRLHLNLINEDLLLDSDVVIHLAGKAHDLRNYSNSDEYYKINYGLTKKIFDAFLNSGAKRFIFVSSVKAVADELCGILKEDHSPDPQTDYGKSKLMAEKYIQSQILPVGKSYVILRPCMIHGPGNKGNLNLLYNVVKKGIPYPLGAFHNLRSFLSVDNLNFIIEKVLSDPLIPSGIYNVADDDALSTNNVIEIIAQVNGNKAKIWRISQRIIIALAKIGDKLHLPLNSERLQKLTESYIVSNEKIKRTLNIQNLPTSSINGLSRTIRSFHSS